MFTRVVKVEILIYKVSLRCYILYNDIHGMLNNETSQYYFGTYRNVH